VAELDLDHYLARLGLRHPGPPSVAGLFALHRAHVARVPYENIEIQLGRATTVDAHEAAARILDQHRGGYCFHINGAFALLLEATGYDVRRHVGGVQSHDEPAPVGATGNHLALTVHGLPDPACPDGVWLADAGLGDGPFEPVPLRPGRYRQGPFVYGVRPSDAVPGGWRFDHDATGSFAGMDFGPAEAVLGDFAAEHERLSTSPDSSFLRVLAIYRRDADGVDFLRGCVLARTDAAGRREKELETPGEWYAALADVFGLPLADVSSVERAALWARVRAAHDAWLAGVLL
jgi:N-hydroxyarylamine O-acetyltransferase